MTKSGTSASLLACLHEKQTVCVKTTQEQKLAVWCEINYLLMFHYQVPRKTPNPKVPFLTVKDTVSEIKCPDIK